MLATGFAQATPLEFTFNVPSVTATFDGVPQSTGNMTIVVTLDSTTVPNTSGGSHFFQVDSAKVTAPDLGLLDTAITSTAPIFLQVQDPPAFGIVYLTSNPGGGLFLWSLGLDRGEVLPAANLGDLGTYTFPFTVQKDGYRLRTNLNAGAPITFANGGAFDIGQLVAGGAGTIDGRTLETADHSGTEFIFGYIPNKENEGPVSLSLQVLSDGPADVTVEYPLGTQITSFSTTADSVFGVSVPVAAHNSWPGTAVTSNAVRVAATAPVSVVTRTTGFGANDRGLVLPVDVLGSEYIIASKLPAQSLGGEYVVVAAQNGTQVQINGGTAIALNRGQGFLRTGTNLAGTVITSNLPVAVTNGNKCASVPSGIDFCEHMTEYAVPVPKWGTQVLARNIPNQNVSNGVRSTLYRILGSQNSTTVNLNGVFLGNVNRGTVLEVTRSGSQTANHFSASNPILVSQYSNSVCDEWPGSLACTGGFPSSQESGDASMVTLLPTNQYVQRSTFTGAERINLIANTTDAQNSLVLLDGVAISPGSFSTFASSPGFSHALLSVSTTGFHSIESPNGHSASGVLLIAFSTESWPAAMQFEAIVPSVCGNAIVEIAEQCDDGGTAPGDCCSPTCLFEPGTTECRAAAGLCDVAETCTGTDGTCPLDVLLPVSTACRAAADICDIAEVCTGASASCPAEAFEPATTTCRAAVGLCDIPEMCTGSGVSCPADALEPPSLECRPSIGVCDLAELCTGSGGTCPADVFQPNGNACDDADACTLDDACSAGSCVGTLSPDPDGDGLCDVLDNCPVVFNPLQENTDPLSAGDACQCGDLNGNAGVDAEDLEIARKNLVGVSLAGHPFFDFTRCNVVGPSDMGVSDCNVDDLYVLARLLAGAPATVQNVCSAYTGL